MKKTTILWCLITLLSSLSFDVVAQLDYADYKRLEEEMLKDIAERNGKIVIDGIVVDQDGQPLNGVNVSIKRSISSGFDRKCLKLRVVVNGNFNYEFDNNNSVSLQLAKDGYYSENFSYHFIDNDEKYNEHATVRLYKNQRIVMTKMGEIAHFRKYDPTLVCSLSGTATVWDISNIDVSNTRTVYKTVLLDLNHPPSGSVFAAFAADDTEGMPNSIGAQCFPDGKKVRIGLLDGKEGGFILCQSTGTRRTFKREMKEAPASGYQPVIELRRDDIVRCANLESNYFLFYFRINGYYGKGKVRALYYNKNENSLFVELDFYIQPNSSRNVEG